jgi:exodeoxyribonuclease V
VCSDFVPSEHQKQCESAVLDWWNNTTKQDFLLDGPAGSGKSSLIQHVVRQVIGLPDGESLYATYTGKAAYVLRQKGVPCGTIHRLIYIYKPASRTQIAKVQAEIEDLKGQMAMFGQIDETVLRQKKSELEKLTKPKFSLNEESALAGAKLLVLDECSMVGKQIADDLRSFGVRMLIIGDQHQLPPIRNKKGLDSFGFAADRQPDFRLTELHRAALDHPITAAATKARNGEPIPYAIVESATGGFARCLRRSIRAEDLVLYNQVLCGFNKTRYHLNNEMRQFLGYTGDLPNPGEKVIILKNKHDLGLFNGQFVTMTNVTRINDIMFNATIITEDGTDLGAHQCYAGEYLDHKTPDPDRFVRDAHIADKLIHSTFGHAITVHKAQGSEWSTVAIWNDHWCYKRDPTMYQRWLYTAITRGADFVCVYD